MSKHAFIFNSMDNVFVIDPVHHYIEVHTYHCETIYQMEYIYMFFNFESVEGGCHPILMNPLHLPLRSTTKEYY